MSKPQPSLARLNGISIALEGLSSACEACFKKQLVLCPTSVQTLRRYSQFMSDVVNNPVMAQKLSDQADDVEDALAKDASDSSMAVTFFQKVRHRAVP